MKKERALEACYLKLYDLPFHEFVSVLLVLMEVKCEECGVDVVELANSIPGMVKAVNDECGEVKIF